MGESVCVWVGVCQTSLKLWEHHPREEFGGAYMELRGKRKARFTRLSTGPAMVGARTDCWLTYDEFKKLTV